MITTTEDAAIMFERARLERFWRDELDNDDRAAWIDRWQSRPPWDAVGRRYVISERPNLTYTVRPAATVYAWSQIFGTYRLKLDPIRRPVPATEAALLVTVTDPRALSLTATVTAGGAAPDGFSFVLHATELRPLSRPPKVTDLRPIGAFIHGTDGVALKIAAAYAARFSPGQRGRALLRAQMVNENNELVPSATVTTWDAAPSAFYYALAQVWP